MTWKVPLRGTEEGPNSSGKTGSAHTHDALYDALSDDSIPNDPDLVDIGLTYRSCQEAHQEERLMLHFEKLAADFEAGRGLFRHVRRACP
jgi:hypothetical protein